MATLKQIANEAGVSIQTVANVLQGRNKERWPAVARRAKLIREIADRLEYRPDASAKSMRTGRFDQIGILIRNNPRERFRNPTVMEMIFGINEGLEKAGFVGVLVRVGDLDDTGRSRVFRERMLDGIIVVSQIPSLLVPKIDRISPYCIWVDTDLHAPEGCIRRNEKHAGELAAKSLIDLGYQKLLWFGGSPPGKGQELHYSVAGRLAGVREMAWQNHASLHELMCSHQAIYHDPQRLLKWLRPDVGVIAYSTAHARWLLSHAASWGLSCPYDYGLVCCDDSHTLTVQWPGLSRVTFNRFSMGLKAAEMMVKQLRHEPCPSMKLKGHWRAGNTAWGPNPPDKSFLVRWPLTGIQALRGR